MRRGAPWPIIFTEMRERRRWFQTTGSSVSSRDSWRETCPNRFPARHDLCSDQPVLIGERKGVDVNVIHHRERRGGRADSQSGDHDGRDREARRVPQRPKCVPQVLAQDVEVCSADAFVIASSSISLHSATTSRMPEQWRRRRAKTARISAPDRGGKRPDREQQSSVRTPSGPPRSKSAGASEPTSSVKRRVSARATEGAIRSNAIVSPPSSSRSGAGRSFVSRISPCSSIR